MSKAWFRILSLVLMVAGWRSDLRAQPVHPEYLGEGRPRGVPERVVSLAPNLTEILFALGAGTRVVGVTNYDDYPEQVKSIPSVGGFIDPSLEGILALKPGLVVCVPNPGAKDRLKTLARMGIPVLVLPDYGLKDIFAAILELGRIFDLAVEAARLTEEMQRRIDAVQKRIKDRPRPRVLMVYGHKPITAAGHGSFADDLLILAGGENVLSDSKFRYPAIPLEEVIRLAPEVIVDASSSGSGAEVKESEALQAWKRFEVIPAVKQSRVFVFNSSVWFRPGPRIVDGLEKLACILHPLDKK